MPGMGGMGAGTASGNPLIVAAFHGALRVEALVVAVVIGACLLAWQPLARLGRRRLGASLPPVAAPPEPAGRRLLRLGFGLLWVLDGALQAKQGMVIGLPASVVGPAAAGSPRWVHAVVGVGLGVWTRHPIAAATSVVWIQMGVGLLLVFAPRWELSRLAGLLSCGWGMLVWVFGEAFGGVFAGGQTWLFGTPGAVLIYAVAGAVLALPERAWGGPRLGRVLTSATGAAFAAFAVLQAWPGRGFWQGGPAGRVPSMASSMATTRQPPALASAVAAFGRLAASHGLVVNLVVVLALAFVGVALLAGRPRLATVGVAVATALCLATWVLAQDMGWFGDVATDPNSMLPWVLLVGGGHLAWVRVPLRGKAPAAPGVCAALPAAPATAAATAPARRPATRLLTRLVTMPTAAVTATLAAVGILLVGAVPATAAVVQPGTSALPGKAIDGTPHRGAPAPEFALVDQCGRHISLSNLRGRVVALTFLDPVRTSASPLIAQQLRLADLAVGRPSGTAFVAIVAGPEYRSGAVMAAFDHAEALTSLPNWYHLTGSLPALSRVWRSYGIALPARRAGAGVAPAEETFVIDGHGRLPWLPRRALRLRPIPLSLHPDRPVGLCARPTAAQKCTIVLVGEPFRRF